VADGFFASLHNFFLSLTRGGVPAALFFFLLTPPGHFQSLEMTVTLRVHPRPAFCPTLPLSSPFSAVTSFLKSKLDRDFFSVACIKTLCIPVLSPQLLSLPFLATPIGVLVLPTGRILRDF